MQLRVSMTLAEMRSHLEHTVKVMTRLHNLPNNPHQIDKVPTVQELETDMKDALRVPRAFENLPMVFCDPKVTAPQLDCGQHRRQALMSMHKADVLESDQSPEKMQVSVDQFRRFRTIV